MLDELTPADIRSLNVFRTVTESGGFTVAEERLGIGQSTISLQLSRLERRLGYRLCDRGRGGFKLTARGQALLAAHERLAGAIESFRQTAVDLSGQIVGTLRLGLMDHTATDERFSPTGLIRRFLEHAPEVRLEIVQDIQSVLREQVLTNRLDFAIGAFALPDSMLDAEPLYVERQHIHCGPQHPRFGLPGATPSAAALEAASWVRRSYALEPRNGFPLRMENAIATATNLEAVAVILQAAPVLGYLPDHFAEALARRGLLRRVTDRFWIEYDIALLSRSGRRDSAAMRRFRATAVEMRRDAR